MFVVIHQFMEKYLAATMYNPAEVITVVNSSDIVM
jgi:hypothetical protein